MNITDREIYRSYLMRNATIGILCLVTIALAIFTDGNEKITFNKFEKIGLFMLIGYMASVIGLTLRSYLNASIPKPKSIQNFVSVAAKISMLGIVLSSVIIAFVVVATLYAPEGYATNNPIVPNLILASFSAIIIIVSLLVRDVAMGMASMYLSNIDIDD